MFARIVRSNALKRCDVARTFPALVFSVLAVNAGAQDRFANVEIEAAAIKKLRGAMAA